MKTYLDLLQRILDQGVLKDDRTGHGTWSLFGVQLRFDLTQGFPLVTTKKIHWPSVVHELLWFLRGDTSLDYLHQHGVTIWDEWADEKGQLGNIYGKQWRAWPTPDGRHIDQLEAVLQNLKTRPNSRRLLISAWNVADLPDESMSPQQNVACGKMALAPCHVLFQFYVAKDKLSCQVYQRSCDTFLGLPFNIASYALLTHLVAQQCGLQPFELIWVGGDVHVYRMHLQQAREQLTRTPYPLPRLSLARCPPTLADYRFEDIVLENYQYHPAIKAPIAV